MRIHVILFILSATSLLASAENLPNLPTSLPTNLPIPTWYTNAYAAAQAAGTGVVIPPSQMSSLLSNTNMSPAALKALQSAVPTDSLSVDPLPKGPEDGVDASSESAFPNDDFTKASADFEASFTNPSDEFNLGVSRSYDEPVEENDDAIRYLFSNTKGQQFIVETFPDGTFTEYDPLSGKVTKSGEIDAYDKKDITITPLDETEYKDWIRPSEQFAITPDAADVDPFQITNEENETENENLYLQSPGDNLP